MCHCFAQAGAAKREAVARLPMIRGYRVVSKSYYCEPAVAGQIAEARACAGEERAPVERLQMAHDL